MINLGDNQLKRIFKGDDEVIFIYLGDDKVYSMPVIEFEDANVKAICVANWGGNIIPNEITVAEAAAVTTLVPSGGSNSAFYYNTQIETFNELKYFTGLTTLNTAFRGCSNLSEITFPAATLSGNTCLTNCVDLTKVKIVDLRPLNINQSVAVDVRLHMNGSAVMEEVYFPQMEVRTLYSAFSGWTKLKKIDFSRCDFGSMAARASSQSTTAYAFNNCTSLTTIVGGFPNTKQDVPLGSCSSLTHDSALAVLNSLGTITSGSATVTFHKNVHLTVAEVAIGTNKGFTVTGYTLDVPVTTNLENVTCDAPNVASGSLTARLSGTNGKKVQESSVIVTMGGDDITSTAYDHSTKTITISSVTGDISITAVGIHAYDAEVEWIKTDGNAYINTGVKISSAITFDFDMYITTPDKIFQMFGGRSSSSANKLYCYNSVSGGTCVWHYGSKSVSFTKLSMGRHTFKNTSSPSRTLVVDGTGHSTTSSSISSTDVDFYILTINVDGGGPALANMAEGSGIYSGKMYSSGTLVRDFIPVRENGVGYLYDKVSEELFGNANSSGAFTYGNDVTR